MTTLIAHFDDATKLEKVIALFKSLKVPFQFKPSDANETDDIVWDWEGCDDAAYELSLEVFSDDWNSEADKVWDTV